MRRLRPRILSRGSRAIELPLQPGLWRSVDIDAPAAATRVRGGVHSVVKAPELWANDSGQFAAFGSAARDALTYQSDAATIGLPLANLRLERRPILGR